MSHLPTILAALIALTFAMLWLKQRKLNIRAREQMSLGLVEQKKTLRTEQDSLLNALTDSFILIDAHGDILFANDTTTELVAGRLVDGRNIKEVLLDSRLRRAIEKSLASGRQEIERVVIPQQSSPGGIAETRTETAWLVDAAPLDRNTKKTVTRVVIRDVSTENQTEQVRKDFVANASHELRTPLSIINGYLENMVEGEIDDPAFLQRSLIIMQKHGDRLARIVEDMLVISRLESGESATLNLSPFLFSDCVQDVIDRLEPVISEQSAQIQLQIEDEKLSLLGDRFYWTQVFFNLIENALKQNAKQALTLEVGSKLKADGGITLWISDNGVGIPNSDLPYIFKRFYRVEKHHNQDSVKGTGLGLSIVKRAIEAHQGTISVSSVPGQKTSFSIQLPSSMTVTEQSANQDSSEVRGEPL